jgi:hypothetical protein
MKSADLSSLLFQKKLQRKMRGLLCLFCLVYLSFGFFYQTKLDETKEQAAQAYGSWQLQEEKLSPSAQEIIKKNSLIEQYAFIEPVQIQANHISIEAAFIQDTNYFSLQDNLLLAGDYPQNEGEICLDERVLEYLSLPKEINQTIEISFLSENMTIKKTVVLCGILEANQEEK